MKTAALVFPNQLFEDNPATKKTDLVYQVEENLFFKQFNFHKQKLVFHRASMKSYQDHLEGKGKRIVYVDSNHELSDVRKLIPRLKHEGVDEVHFTELIDDRLQRRMVGSAASSGMKLRQYESPMFLNSKDDLTRFFEGRKRYSQTDFYVHQRKKLNILIEGDGRPLGGKWTYDSENRLKYPSHKKPPKVEFPALDQYSREAMEYVQQNFPDNYGEMNQRFNYPITFEESKKWLGHFLETRLGEFGPYEDAIVANEPLLNHSLLTPMLNVGLLTPDHVLKTTLAFAEKERIPLSSLEGFIRQIVGWREFVRAVYELKGPELRTTNHWKFDRKIPASFWRGETGIGPMDLTIKKVLETGYCHHIERLMVLGNFMLLCEFDPTEVYRWYMELFIDAYDWVMVPNVYGMSQFADGGLMSTKPYISGSNYLMKMSDYKKGDWQPIWDGLFWRFMDKHREFFLSNPRLGMLIATFDKMEEERKQELLRKAEDFLRSF